MDPGTICTDPLMERKGWKKMERLNLFKWV